MSSTEKPTVDSATRRLLEKFWTQQLLPAAAALRSRDVRFFDLAPDASVKTYYSRHQNVDAPFVALEPADWESLLREMWQREGLPELATLAGPLMALAQKLKLREEEQADVSPFIYVMF
jgi:hypothetical protein